MFRPLNPVKSFALLAAAVFAVGTPLRPVSAQTVDPYRDSAPRTSYDAPAGSTVDRDRADLDAARKQLDQIAAARERAQREIDDLQKGSGVSANMSAAQAKADLDRMTAERDALRDQVKSIQQKLDDAKASADKYHDDKLQALEQTDAFKAGAADFDKARMDLKGPTDRVLDSLQQTREFQEAVTAARAAKANEDKLRQDTTADPKAVREAEQAFIAADNKVQELEERALTADPQVTAGRKAVDAARDRLRAMRDRFEEDLLKDPAFAPTADEVRRQEAALAAGTDDLKKMDLRIAALRTVADGKAPATAEADPAALRDAQARLDKINRDYDDVRRDVERFEARVRDNADTGLNISAREPAPVAPGGAYEPAVIERVVERPVYTETVYEPAYDYYPPVYYGGTYISLSYNDYCSRPRYYYGYGGSFSWRDCYYYTGRGHHDRWHDWGYHRYSSRPYYGSHGGSYGHGYAGNYGRNYYHGSSGSRSSSNYGSHYDRDSSRGWHDPRNVQIGSGSRSWTSSYGDRSDRRDRDVNTSYASSYAAYRERVQRRAADAQSDYRDRVERRATDTARAQSEYRERVERRAADAQSDYRERVERRATDAAKAQSEYRDRVERRASSASTAEDRERAAYRERVERRASEASNGPSRSESSSRHSEPSRVAASTPPSSSHRSEGGRSSPAPSPQPSPRSDSGGGSRHGSGGDVSRSRSASPAPAPSPSRSSRGDASSSSSSRGGSSSSSSSSRGGSSSSSSQGGARTGGTRGGR